MIINTETQCCRRCTIISMAFFCFKVKASTDWVLIGKIALVS